MKSSFMVFLALGAVSVLSADYYNSSCPGGNCPYQGQNSRQYPEASGQAYYNEHPEHFRQSQQGGYNQNRSDRGQGYYNQSQPYNSRGQYNRQDGYYNPSDRSIQKNMSDADIKKEVNDVISSGWLSSGYPNVNFDVNNGNVDLSGTVKNQDEKAKLESSIRKIDGVRQINNQVMINANERSDSNMRKDESNMYREGYNRDNQYQQRNDYNMRMDQNARNDSYGRNASMNPSQDNAATESDRRINEKVRDHLKGWFSNDFEMITLNTTDGVVTIIGYVQTPEDLEKINKEVKKVDGVRSVNNKASVQQR